MNRKKMLTEKKNKLITFYIDENDEKIILEHMKELDIKNKSEYLRKMAVEGFLIKRDFTVIKRVSIELSKINNNIIQLKMRANEVNQFQNECEEIQQCMNKLFTIVRKYYADEIETKLDKVIIHEFVIKRDYSKLNCNIDKINKLGCIINNIVKRINETRNIYPQDIKELKERINEIWLILHSTQ